MMMRFSILYPDRTSVSTPQQRTHRFVFKMMDFAFKMMDFAFKMMNFALKMMDFAFKMMDV